MRPPRLSRPPVTVAARRPAVSVCESSPPALRQSAAVKVAEPPLSCALSETMAPVAPRSSAPAEAIAARSRRRSPAFACAVTLAACVRLPCSCSSAPSRRAAPPASVTPLCFSAPSAFSDRSPVVPTVLSALRPAAKAPLLSMAPACTSNVPPAAMVPPCVRVPPSIDAAPAARITPALVSASARTLKSREATIRPLPVLSTCCPRTSTPRPLSSPSRLSSWRASTRRSPLVDSTPPWFASDCTVIVSASPDVERRPPVLSTPCAVSVRLRAFVWIWPWRLSSWPVSATFQSPVPLIASWPPAWRQFCACSVSDEALIRAPSVTRSLAVLMRSALEACSCAPARSMPAASKAASTASS